MTTTAPESPSLDVDRLLRDAELMSVLIALAPLGRRARAYVDVAAREFDPRIHDQAWSTGERVLIDLARALWKGHGDVDLAYIATQLDGRFFNAAINAIAARGKRDFRTGYVAALGAALVQGEQP